MESSTSTPRRALLLLCLAATAVCFAAADTYVVVLSLPDMMTATGINAEELHKAAPIISGFLLGYVAMLPLIGRIADVRGQIPVLVASLVVFSFGSLLTAAAYDLSSLIVGRFFQGLGGGGLVPVTLALVASIYPPQRRGVPLGIVGAVQELGSVLGPLYGALVLAIGDWRDIFWINLAVGLVLAAAVVASQTGTADPPTAPRSKRLDVIGSGLVTLSLAAILLVMLQPKALVTSVAWGGPFVPFADSESVWFSPVGLGALALVLATVLRCSLAKNPIIDVRGWGRAARAADLVGAVWIALLLGGIILAFATADPAVEVFTPLGIWFLAGSAVALMVAIWHQRRATNPLIPHQSLRPLAAWGSLVVSFFVGSALIAALVDIPVFARLADDEATQLQAALVLLEFLVALPVGAILGGWLMKRVSIPILVGAGMTLACLGFVAMSRWDLNSLESHWSILHLVATGFGFGLVLAPINAALLVATPARDHGVSSALLVVCRMVGMLVGISALTTIGLRRFYELRNDLPQPGEVCGGISATCDEYTRLLSEAGIAQLHTVFVGAAICAAIAALVGVAVFAKSGHGSGSGPILPVG